jgi:acetyl esterase/lipase
LRGGAPNEPACIARVTLEPLQCEVLRKASTVAENPELRACFSTPSLIEFPTASDKTAFLWYYPPHNPAFAAPSVKLPPLVVKCHGGPTAAASSTLDLQVQFWTSRGFAVADVDYRGSSGYGREYRERLHMQWGVVDVEDCTNAAKYLAGKNLADPARAAITGGSAGGYTTLCALTFADYFKIGASHYGVCDLETLATDTHKFESHYLDWLVGKYPEERQTYIDRSPIHATDRLKVPVILFQGEEDKIVANAEISFGSISCCQAGLPRYFRRGSYGKRTGGFTESIRKAGWRGLMRAFCSTWTITLGTSSATLRCSITHWSPMFRLAVLAGSESQRAGRSPMEGFSVRSSGISMAKSHRSSNRRGVRMCASVSRQASATELEA